MSVSIRIYIPPEITKPKNLTGFGGKQHVSVNEKKALCIEIK